MAGKSGRVTVNTRILAGHLTGVQRYLLSILANLPGTIDQIGPVSPLHGICGHSWEQIVLPKRLAGGELLWSPSNTGPLSVAKQVLTVHDLVALDHPEFLNPRFAAWYRFLLPKLARRVRRIIAVSEFTKRRLVEALEIPEDRVSVILNGVDDRFCTQSEEQISTTREKLGIPSRHYLVALGSLEPRKNLKRLLEAWSRAVSGLPDDVWLVVAGVKGKAMVFDGLSFDPLPPRVYLSGHVPDELLPALYAGAIAAPYLSVYEGFGLPPLEAMACGTPALTGNRTALPEVIGDAALMVDPYKVGAICEGLTSLVTDRELRENLRQRGLERARQFTWKRAAEQTWWVLQQAAVN